jgi:hypothetical protein
VLQFLVTANAVPSSLILLTLMKAKRSSERSATSQKTAFFVVTGLKTSHLPNSSLLTKEQIVFFVTFFCVSVVPSSEYLECLGSGPCHQTRQRPQLASRVCLQVRSWKEKKVFFFSFEDGFRSVELEQGIWSESFS